MLSADFFVLDARLRAHVRRLASVLSTCLAFLCTYSSLCICYFSRNDPTSVRARTYKKVNTNGGVRGFSEQFERRTVKASVTVRVSSFDSEIVCSHCIDGAKGRTRKIYLTEIGGRGGYLDRAFAFDLNMR